MNKITLTRPKESVNKFYSYPILINNEPVTKLANYTEEALSVNSNNVTIEATVGWAGSGSKEITFQNREHIKLQVTANNFYNKVVRYTGGIAFPSLAAIWLVANHIQGVNYGAPILGIIILLYLIYTLVIDKENWIIIKEVKD